jgi:hypothetical protein
LKWAPVDGSPANCSQFSLQAVPTILHFPLAVSYGPPWAHYLGGY